MICDNLTRMIRLFFVAAILTSCMSSPDWKGGDDGGPCESDYDCKPFRICLTEAEGFPGGLCSKSCEIGGDECKPGGLCVTVDDEPRCLLQCEPEIECEPDADTCELGDGGRHTGGWLCRDEYVCHHFPPTPFTLCVPGAR